MSAAPTAAPTRPAIRTHATTAGRPASIRSAGPHPSGQLGAPGGGHTLRARVRSAVRSVNPAAPAGRSEQLLREAAWRLEHGYPTGSAAVRSAIADVLRAALDELAST